MAGKTVTLVGSQEGQGRAHRRSETALLRDEDRQSILLADQLTEGAVTLVLYRR
jgi:hypothetical protein